MFKAPYKWHDCIAPLRITLFQEWVLNWALAEWNALSKIPPSPLPPPRCFSTLRLGTRWSFVFIRLWLLHVVDNLSPSSLLFLRHLLQTSAEWKLRESISNISCYQWKWLKNFISFLDSGWGGFDLMKNFFLFFFWRLPIRNDLKSNCEKTLYSFYHWVALITLISLGEKKQQQQPQTE